MKAIGLTIVCHPHALAIPSASIEDVASFLEAWSFQHPTNPGIFATSALRQFSSSYLLPNASPGMWPTEFVLSFNVNGVFIRQRGGNLGQGVRIDSRDDFLEAVGQRLANLINKTVRFTYNGGSLPNEQRTVLVQNIENHRGRPYICGIDLTQARFQKDRKRLVLADGYRRYDTSKVRGSIEVVVN